MKTKSIDWSYPSSPNAIRFGFPAGCWTVSRMNGDNPGEAVAGFATEREAIALANTMDIPYGRYWGKYNTAGK